LTGGAGTGPPLRDPEAHRVPDLLLPALGAPEAPAARPHRVPARRDRRLARAPPGGVGAGPRLAGRAALPVPDPARRHPPAEPAAAPRGAAPDRALGRDRRGSGRRPDRVLD